MFFNSHAYIASKASHNSLLIIGSILPDIAITKIIGWKDLHDEEKTEKFKKVITSRNRNYLELLKGIALHNIVDNLTHNNYRNNRGYAYQNNQKLSNLVSSFYGLNAKRSEEIAHNYIESAVDILLLKNNSHINGLLRFSIKKIDIEELSDLLSFCFKTDRSKTLKALNLYFDLILKYDLQEKNGWISLWSDLEFFLSLKKTDDMQRRKLLNKSLSLTNNSYFNFLENIVEDLKNG